MLELKSIEKRTGLTREIFAKEYLELSKPVVFTDFTESWPAKQKWSIEFFKKNYWNLQVPVFSSNYSKPGKGYMEPDMQMPFGEFLTSIENGKSDLRMFLYNLLQNAPELCEDIRNPTIMDGFLDKFPFMFFGSEGSVVPLHYDIDRSNVFLSQFQGRKRVILFAPEESKNIYHQPFTVASAVDVTRPDYDKFPALKKAKGYECMLMPGETLFMPSGFWHHITYTDSGYSIALRSNDSIVTRAIGLFNIATHFVVDKGMNKIVGANWKNLKLSMARRRAEQGTLV